MTADNFEAIWEIRRDLNAIAARIRTVAKTAPDQAVWEIIRDAREAVDQAITDLGEISTGDVTGAVSETLNHGVTEKR